MTRAGAPKGGGAAKRAAARTGETGVRAVRAALVLGYAGMIVASTVTPHGPRLLWTVLLPMLPLGVVVAGFPAWRRVCPLAAIGELGRRMNRGKQRRVPAWMEERFFTVTFLVLTAMLALRLLATNGDGVWLAALLALLGAAAIVVNRVYTGRSWCHFFCPVGVVERIYTEPRPLVVQQSSICAKCTACKKHCPDIDTENAYWHDTGSAPRRLATYAFPGVVLAFYLYYYLRAGDWEAYFDGRWTARPVDADLVLGAGFFFAPALPAVVAAPLTLAALGAASYALFTGVERLAERVVRDRSRHVTLGLAAFAAFNLFYLFAGAPTLRQLPGATRLVAMLAPAVGMLFLIRRWVRDREHYVQEKGAAKLLKRWPFETPPPKDPAAMLAVFEHHEHARETAMGAYRDTLSELLADGIVTRDELRLLGQLRRQLGITDADHDRLVSELEESEQALFASVDALSPEHRAQYEGYLRALTEALLDGATEERLEELRDAWGIDPETHVTALADARGAAGPVQARARGFVARLRERRTTREAACSGDGDELTAFIQSILESDERVLLGRVLEAIRATEPTATCGDVDSLLACNPDALATLDGLSDRCPLAGEAKAALEATAESTNRVDALRSLLDDANPWLRAAAVRACSRLPGDAAAEALAVAKDDPNPIVRGAASKPATAETSTSILGHAGLDQVLALRRVPLFAKLGPEDLRGVAELATEHTYRNGDVVVAQGERARELFVILEGAAAVTVDDGTGEPRRVATRGTGEVLGELAMIDGEARSATVTAESDTLRVLRLDGPRFLAVQLPRPAISGALVRSLVARVREGAGGG